MTAVQRQTALTAYFSSKQLLLFVFGQQDIGYSTVCAYTQQSVVITKYTTANNHYIILGITHMQILIIGNGML